MSKITGINPHEEDREWSTELWVQWVCWMVDTNPVNLLQWSLTTEPHSHESTLQVVSKGPASPGIVRSHRARMLSSRYHADRGYVTEVLLMGNVTNDELLQAATYGLPSLLGRNWFILPL